MKDFVLGSLHAEFCYLSCYSEEIINFKVFYKLHSKKSLLIVKLRSFQNAPIEIEQISLSINTIVSLLKKLTCKMQNKNIFTDRRFLLTQKRNPLTIKGLHF